MDSYNLIIILIIILVIIYYFFNIEGFQNSMYYIDNLKIYYIKELVTGKTLLVDYNGVVYFNYPDQTTKHNQFCDNNGLPLAMSKNPTSSLLLRSGNEPNIHLVASFDGNYIRLVPNPADIIGKIEVINYNNKNILGYNTSGNIPKYLKVNEEGHICSVKNPDAATIVGIVKK